MKVAATAHSTARHSLFAAKTGWQQEDVAGKTMYNSAVCYFPPNHIRETYWLAFYSLSNITIYDKHINFLVWL